MTVVWNVNNLKILHKNGDTVDALTRKLSERYEKEADLIIHRGKVHTYLGINIDYHEQGKVKIDMTDYPNKILDDLPDKYQGRAITPATNHIFEVNETARKLREKDAQAFYTIVEKLLFLCKQTQPDILTGVDFLTTRVIYPNKDKDKKLARILKYIRGRRDILLTLESDGIGTVKWGMDAEFAVYHNTKSQTGGMMTMGRGALYSA